MAMVANVINEVRTPFLKKSSLNNIAATENAKFNGNRTGKHIKSNSHGGISTVQYLPFEDFHIPQQRCLF